MNAEGIRADIANGGDPLLYKQACNGNGDAFLFLTLFHEYCHEIDDLIDGKTPITPESLLTVLSHANLVYSCAFYRQHCDKLMMVVQLVTNTYADSVAWEKSDVDWKAKWGDVLRFAGLEMVYAVAAITGGYEHMRKLSQVLKENAWKTHHNPDGAPV